MLLSQWKNGRQGCIFSTLFFFPPFLPLFNLNINLCTELHKSKLSLFPLSNYFITFLLLLHFSPFVVNTNSSIDHTTAPTTELLKVWLSFFSLISLLFVTDLFEIWHSNKTQYFQYVTSVGWRKNSFFPSKTNFYSKEFTQCMIIFAFLNKNKKD